MKVVSLNFCGVFLVFNGLITLAVGLYLLSPTTIPRLIKANWAMGAMLIVGVVILILTYKPGGVYNVVGQSIAKGAQFLPLMVMLCTIMGIGIVLTEWHQAVIQAFILRHHIVGPIVAALLTPTSNALAPIVDALWETVRMRPWCLFYVQASVLMSAPLFMLRSMGFSHESEIPLRMYIAGVVTSVVLIVFAVPMYALVEQCVPVWHYCSATLYQLVERGISIWHYCRGTN